MGWSCGMSLIMLMAGDKLLEGARQQLLSAGMFNVPEALSSWKSSCRCYPKSEAARNVLLSLHWRCSWAQNRLELPALGVCKSLG